MTDTAPETEKVPEWVHITHPDYEGPPAGPVTGEAFTLVYEPKGWKIVGQDEVIAAAEDRVIEVAAAEAATAEEIAAMDSREALEKVALLRGIDPTQFQEFKGSRPVGEYNLEGLRAALIADVTAEVDPTV